MYMSIYIFFCYVIRFLALITIPQIGIAFLM